MIIGLSGYARSGKNTVADMLGSDYRQIAFADPMRKALYALDPTINGVEGSKYFIRALGVKEAVDLIGWDKVKSEYPEVRRLLQVLGTEVGREMFGENFWVHMAIQGILPEDNVVFTDVRFMNEAIAIKNMKGEVWRINRDGVGAVNAHPSETALDTWEFDRVIDNNGTLDELREKVKV